MHLATFSWKLANNSTVVHPKDKCLPSSCSSRDSALNNIVCIAQSLNMATRKSKIANDFKMSSNPVCKDCITGVIHPKVKLYIWNCNLFHKLLCNVNNEVNENIVQTGL